MRIEFVTPQCSLTRDAGDSTVLKFPQLTVPLLAALTPPDVAVGHSDESVGPVQPDAEADLVAITCTTPAAPRAYELADAYRARGVAVVLGGPHPTLLPGEAGAHADAVVVGEAEETWPRLVADFRRGSMAAIYRSERPPSLRGLPHPRRDLIQGDWLAKGVVLATRGCPNACEYCTLPSIYHRSVRCRPVAEVAAEVESIEDMAIVFLDDNVAANPLYARELFRAIAPLNKWWAGQATVKLAEDDETLRLAAASGCKGLFLGIESFSQDSLDGTNKRFNRVERYRELVARLHGVGIAVQAGIMFGFDGDGPDVFARTVQALEEMAVDHATMSLVVPFPGTPLFERLERAGRILTHDWARYNGRTDVVFAPKLMSPEALQEGFEWARGAFKGWATA